MKHFLKTLLIIPILLCIIMLGYGFVNMIETMKTFENDGWVISILTLGLLAVVPVVIYMVAQTEADDPDQEDDQEHDDQRLD